MKKYLFMLLLLLVPSACAKAAAITPDSFKEQFKDKYPNLQVIGISNPDPIGTVIVYFKEGGASKAWYISRCTPLIGTPPVTMCETYPFQAEARYFVP